MNFEEAKSKALESFGGDDLASSVFFKYALNNNEGQYKEYSMKQLRKRLYNGIIDAEKEHFGLGNSSNKELKELFNHFIFAGRILYALNNPYDGKSTYSNCYVTDIASDSLDSIFDTAKKQAIVFSRGGGIGFDVSTLRPKGAPVNNSAKTTTGAVSFMDLYSLVTGLIGQYGRRGALMLSISCTHPDLIDFITVKAGADKDKIRNANISVRVTNEFMEAVENDADWGMSFELENGDVFNKIEKARTIWDLLVDSNRRGAEPGILFWDNIIDDDPASIFEETRPISTNPCVSGDTPILTDAGFTPIAEVVGKKVNVWNGEEWSEVEPRITGENQEMLLVSFNDGTTLRCTKYHRFPINKGNGEELILEAQELKIGMRLSDFEIPVIESGCIENESNYKYMYTKGFYSGDGTCSASRPNRKLIHLYGEKKELLEYLDFHRCECGDGRYTLTLSYDKDWNKTFVPDTTYTINERMNWFAGLLDSDGTVTKDGGLQIWSIDRDFLYTVKEMLFTCGCASTLLKGRDERKELLPNGHGGYSEYHCKSSYRLCIPKWASVEMQKMGLVCRRLQLHDSYKYKRNILKVISIADGGIADKVYCFTEPKLGKGTFGCVSTMNCAEEPLEKGGACVLGSMDLNTFVVNSFTENASFDYNKFDLMVKQAVRALDDIVELNLSRQPLEENVQAAKLGRRIGLGFTGLADTLIRLGMVYDSDEAIEWVDKTMAIFKKSSIEGSIDLAIERGPFELFNKTDKIDEFISHPYFSVLSDEYKEKLRTTGIRNVGINTVAPNGSISIILQTSSGLEPIFRTEYERTVIQGNENGEKKKFTTYHPLVLEYNKVHGEGAHKESNLFVTSDKIDWVQRVKMQATIQKHISQSISSTINLPKGTTNDVIDTIYREAWKQKLKGVTIYVDESREGVLNETKSESSKNEQDVRSEFIEDVKFPSSGEARFKVIKSEKKKWYCFYTLDNEGKPNSLFVNTNSIEQSILTENVLDELHGLLEKYISKDMIDDLVKKYSHQTNVVKITRVLSMLLRHRVPITEIVTHIDKVSPPLYSFIFQIKKLLVEFIEGEYTGKKCNCGAPLVYEAGCSICRDCGESSCG